MAKWQTRYGMIALLLAFIVCTGWLALKWLDTTPVSIGFVGQLTGKQMELGVQERDGVLLAVEHVNASGGINGHPLKLIIRDDLGVPDQAREADRALIASGVVAIIGHPTTAQSLAGMEVTNPAKMVLISPTVSSPVVSGKDDYFFRLYPSFKDSAQAFAAHIFQKERVGKIAVILDTDNAGYAKTYSDTFLERFKSLGGEVVGLAAFSSKKQPDLTAMLTGLQAGKPGAILTVASDIDTALIAQRVRLLNWNIPLFSSAWAQTETLINNGGRAVEGMKLEQSFTLNISTPAFLDFRQHFESRFGRSPSFGAAAGYETVMVLVRALEKTGGRREGLKEALIDTKDFPGLMDVFSLDRFGDVERPFFYLSEIRDGKFVFLERLMRQPTR